MDKEPTAFTDGVNKERKRCINIIKLAMPLLCGCETCSERLKDRDRAIKLIKKGDN